MKYVLAEKRWVDCGMLVIKQLDAYRQLNTTFMRFVFFALEFNLVENIDRVSQQAITRVFKEEYLKHIE